jgi:hypothetical protein
MCSKRFFTVFLIVFIILTACGRNDTSNSIETPAGLMTQNPPDLGTPPLPPSSGAHLTVVLIHNSLPRSETTHCIEIPNDFASQHGFNISFETLYTRSQSFNAIITLAPVEILRRISAYDSHENVLFITDRETAFELNEYVEFADMLASATQWLPEDYIGTALHLNGGDALHWFPTNEVGTINRYPMVAIRMDDYMQFGREIHTVEEYEDFLHWSLNNGSSAATWSSFWSRPSLFDASAHFRMNQSSVYSKTILPLDLFLPGMGYTSLKGMFLRVGGVDSTNHLWMGQDGRAAAWYELDTAAIAFDRYMTWHRDGLIDFVPAYWRNDADGVSFYYRSEGDPTGVLGELRGLRVSEPYHPDFKGHSSLLGAHLYVEHYHDNYTLQAYNFLNPDYFHFNLSAPALAIPDINDVAFALPQNSNDLSEYFRFLHFLLHSNTAYSEFVLGAVNPVDATDITRAGRRHHSHIFHTTRHNWYLYPTMQESNTPIDFTTLYPLSSQQIHEVGATLRRCPDYNAFIDSMNAYLFHYFYYLYTDPHNAMPFYRVMADIRAMPGSNFATRLVNDALGR